MIDIEELLREYPNYVRRIPMLESIITESREINYDSMIEQYALGRSPLSAVPSTRRVSGSKTEDLALKLDELREQYRESIDEKIQYMQEELHKMKTYVTVYNIVIAELTEDERTFVELHFQKGYNLKSLAEGYNKRPMLGDFSLYRLRKMKNAIIEKITGILCEE